MRYLTIALLILSSFVARSEEIPGLSAFAEEYWSAVRSQNPEKIYALYDPRIFSEISPTEAEFLKKQWMKNYADTVKKQGDSYKIESKRLPGDSNLFPAWRWAAKPQFQIEIQTFRKVPNGKERLTGLVETVVQKGDQFFILRPVPPEAVLQKRLKK